MRCVTRNIKYPEDILKVESGLKVEENWSFSTVFYFIFQSDHNHYKGGLN